jgi:bacteriocin-like protein
MNNDVRELNDDELNEVSGGLDCKSAVAVGQFYMGLSKVMYALGNDIMGAYYGGKGSGIITGGCPG